MIEVVTHPPRPTAEDVNRALALIDNAIPSARVDDYAAKLIKLEPEGVRLHGHWYDVDGALLKPSDLVRCGGDPSVSAGAKALLRDHSDTPARAEVYTITLYQPSGKSGYFAAHLHCGPGTPFITAHIEGLTTVEQEAAAVRGLLARRGLAPSEVARWEVAPTASAATARKWGQALLAWLDLRGVQIHIRELIALHSETDRLEGQSVAETPPTCPAYASPAALAAQLEHDAALVRLLNLSEPELAQIHAVAGFDPSDIRAWLRARVIS